MKSYLPRACFLILFLLCFNAYAQEKLTLYYDGNGKGLDTKKKATFYRMVTFDDNNNPIDTVKDFNLNGKLQAKGKALIVDKFDNTKSRWIGQVFLYNEKGRLVELNNYDNEGRLDGIQTTFSDGHKEQEREYLHGNPTKDYYFVYDKKEAATKYSYLTHLPKNLSTSDKKITPFTERKVIYQDGQPVEFYYIDGISVAVKMSTKQIYGNYYEAYVTIENGSNEQFNFDPSYITASFQNDGKVFEGEVMTYNDYIKKVNRRQNWTAAFNAFAQTAAATTAGYSSTYASAHAQTSTGKSAYVQASSTSYNGAAQYAAAQNASNNISQLANQQYDIKQSISEGYLKLNTIFPNSRLIGFVNIKYMDAEHIFLNVPVNGKVYHFEL